MAKKIKASQIEQQLDSLHAAVTKVATWYRNNPDYTDEGRASRYAAAIADKRFDYTGKLEKLAQLIDHVEATARAQASTAKAAALPAAQDPTETLAAELAAQRLLQRPGMDDAQKALALVRDAQPSPGLTLAVQELQERGVIDTDTVDALLRDKSPEYADAHQHAARTEQLTGFLRQRLAKTTKQMTTTQPIDGMKYVPSVHSGINHGWNDETTVDNIPAGVFDDVALDLPYRSG